MGMLKKYTKGDSMERLTNNEYILKTINNAEKDINKLKDIVLRLAEYEDTGLTPKEIKELKEELDISRSEVQGLSRRLIELQADRDYWKAEALKHCAKLGEIKLVVGRSNA